MQGPSPRPSLRPVLFIMYELWPLLRQESLFIARIQSNKEELEAEEAAVRISSTKDGNEKCDVMRCL